MVKKELKVKNVSISLDVDKKSVFVSAQIEPDEDFNKIKGGVEVDVNLYS